MRKKDCEINMIFFFYRDSSQNIQVQTEVAAKWANQPTRKRNQGPIIIGPQGAVLYTIKQNCPHKSKLPLPANLQKSRKHENRILDVGWISCEIIVVQYFRHTSRFSPHGCFDGLPFAAFCLPVLELQ